MIRVFFNENGYYINGEGVEITRRLSPALTERGDRIFQVIHHTYKVLVMALKDLQINNVKEDVIVYNDSRIIDEINGLTKPLDETCEQWLQGIRRSIVPSIKPVVFFRKKTSDYVAEQIRIAHANIQKVDNQKLAEEYLKQREEKINGGKKKRLNKLRKNWFGDKHE